MRREGRHVVQRSIVFSPGSSEVKVPSRPAERRSLAAFHCPVDLAELPSVISGSRSRHATVQFHNMFQLVSGSRCRHRQVRAPVRYGSGEQCRREKRHTANRLHQPCL